MEEIIEKIKIDPLFPELFEKYLNKDNEEKLQQMLLKFLDKEAFNYAEICLKYLKNINFGNLPTQDKKEDNINPLIWACCYGKLNTVKFLVENGADIEHPSFYGSTAIMFAFQNGHIDIVKYLLSKGAKINHESRDMIFYRKIDYFETYLELINFYDAWVRKLMVKIVEISNDKN